MKTIGLIGGMSWESSAEYYRIINERVKEKLGGLHSAQSLMFSFDFHEIETLQNQGKWAEATQRMVQAGRQLERGGADFLVICTNTMHLMADEVAAAVSIPLLHIADATAKRIKAQGIGRIGLLGTKFTMEEEFYKGKLYDKYGLDVFIPGRDGRKVIHDIIYQELVLGVIKGESRQKYKEVMDHLVAAGAEGIILGCTEIGLLVSQEDSPVPLFDTTLIHAETAVDFALA